MALIALTSCSTVSSSSAPTLKEYTQEQQTKAAQTLEAIQPHNITQALNEGRLEAVMLSIDGANLKMFMDGYGNLRARVRVMND